MRRQDLQTEIAKRQTEDYQALQAKKRAESALLEQQAAKEEALKKKKIEDEQARIERTGQVNVATLKNQFENVTHVYSKVGGNIAASGGDNRQPVTGSVPAAQPVKSKEVVDEPKIPVKEKKAVAPKTASLIQSEIKQEAVKPTTSQEELDYEFALKLQQEFDREQEAIDYEFALNLQEQFDQEEAADYEFALKLQEEFDREQEAIDYDHILAAKSQVEEIVNPVAFPQEECLDYSTLDTVAADIYSEGLANLKQTDTTPISQIQDSAENDSAEKYLCNFAVTILIETQSLFFAMTANGFIMQEVRQTMLINMVGNQDDFTISMFSSSYNSVSNNPYSLFAEPKFPSFPTSSKRNSGPIIEEVVGNTTKKQPTQAPTVEDVEEVITPRISWR